jgi:DNA-directed RNA polymerase specialized sigma24 family protein
MDRHGIDRSRCRERLSDRIEASEAVADMLVTLYVEEQLSTIEVADQFGVYPETVRRSLHRLGVDLRPPAHKRDYSGDNNP